MSAHIGTNGMNRLAAVLFVGLAALAGGGCANDQKVLAQASQFQSGLQPAIISETKDAQIANYMQQVGDRIIASARALDQQGYGPKSHKTEKSDWMFSNRMQFHLVNSKTMNAFTTGGEHMYIYNALFQACKNEDELAAVMSHEFAHVYARHVQKGMNNQMALLLGAGAAGAAGYAVGGSEHGQEYAGYGAGLASQVGGLVNAGFTRGDEAQADELGFNFYVRAGWDPAKFGSFFKTLAAQGGDKTPEFLSDHPSLASRAKIADERAAQWQARGADSRKPPVADDNQFRQLQARAAQVARTTPDDSSLQNSQQLLQALPRSCLTPEEPVPADAKTAQQAIVQKAESQQATDDNAKGKKSRKRDRADDNRQ